MNHNEIGIPRSKEAANPLVAEGIQLYHSSNLWGAAQKYKAALVLDPSNAGACSWLIRSLVELRAYTSALALLDRFQSLHFDLRLWSFVYDNIGLAKFNLGDQAGAIAAFQFSLALRPRRARVLVHRGISYDRSGQYDLAYNDALEALRLQPGYPPALHLKQRLEVSGRITPL